MKKKVFLGFACLCSITSFAQSTTIDDGVVVKLAKATHIAFQTDLIIDGQLRCDTSTIISIGATDKNCRIMSNNPLKFYSLNAAGGTNFIDTDSLWINGDIIINTGKLHLPKTTSLNGSILNENETGYVVSGNVRKDLNNLVAGQKATTGLGLAITPYRYYDTITIIRAHEKQSNRGESSITKYYELQTPIDVTAIDFSYLTAQSDKKTDTYLLYHKSSNNDSWQSIDSQTNAETKRVVSKQGTPTTVQYITLFPFPELNYSTYITLNDDGFNDYFEVLGIEKCPNSKLVILTPAGMIIYTGEPYNNDFDGKGLDLSAGAYYYIFFCDKNGSPAKKGYFEIIK
ncbi:MAG: gliding motility-associated C-terminal domain-containing protein [Prevotellaceae bacterium]|jgi:gliding motility-associated-like protein|nr:gliding motility-associated C-terminal domain-containing protein [Prevotellaceae bacterium]